MDLNTVLTLKQRILNKNKYSTCLGKFNSNRLNIDRVYTAD